MAAGSALLVGLVEEFVSGQQDSKAADTATGLKAGQFTILQLVEALGLHLNRLKDHYVITPHVLKGMNALTKCSVLPPGSAVSILKSLFQDVHVQSLMLVERSCVYNILTQLMESRESELKGLGADFVFGFVQSVDGERDPRNLLLAFQIARKIIHGGYDLGKFTEELFEVTSCYFPIDFSPPPNDPHGITQEELILALRAVLTGTPRFAEFLLPLIIEKLDSDVQSAKVDSLQTLTACASVYEHKELAEFLPGLWASLRREVFQTASERVESAGLAALGALTACISRSVLNSDSEDYLNVFLDLVLKDCQHHLCEPDLKLVWPSAKLLQATSTASYRASHRVAAAIMPSLIEQYNSRTQVSHTSQLGHSISVSVDASLPFLTVGNDLSQQSLCSIVFSALSENSAGLQITSLRVLTALSQQTGETPDLSMAQGDSATPSQKHSQQAVRQRCLTALAAVSSQPSVVQESTPVLLQVLTTSHTGTGSFSLEEVISVCHNLQRIAEHAQDTEETGRIFHDIIIPRLLGLALQAASATHCNVLINVTFIEPGKFCKPTKLCCVTRLAGQTASRAVSLFLDGDMSFLPENAFPSQIQILKVRPVIIDRLTVCPGQVEVPQMDRLLLELEELSCTCDHPFSYTSAAKCYAGLVNKRPAGECSSPVLDLSLVNNVTHTAITLCRSQLFSLLSDSELGSLAADGFSLLMSDSPDVLNRGCNADVRIMYRQRFFTENSAKLVQGFNSAAQEKKSGYLKALSHIVNYLPRQVQLTELPALLPLLLEALSCPDQAVQLSTLSCLQPVLMDPPSALITQLEALVGRTLTLTTSPAMKVRIASLRCIHALSRFPEHEIMPFRARVLRALAVPLDDLKRMVRSEAVVARNEWFLLGSPGGR
uniref:MMS19 nucleotide excision repair protein n=1 Tax=Oncorhynchus kisutch TaxID=8019 RepID=A0A8C7IXA1_ONCKI